MYKIKELNEMCQAKDVESVGLEFLLKGGGHYPSCLQGTGQVLPHRFRSPVTVGLNIFEGNLKVKGQRGSTSTKGMKAKVFG